MSSPSTGSRRNAARKLKTTSLLVMATAVAVFPASAIAGKPSPPGKSTDKGNSSGAGKKIRR